MPKKNILYITPALPVGGAEKFLVLLANSLVPETGIQTVISLSVDNKLHVEFDNKVGFIAFPRSGKFDIKPLKKLRNAVRIGKPDIIFCLNFFSYFFIRVAIAGLRNKAPIIISYHSTKHVSKREHLMHKFFSAILQKKDSIITVSKNQALYTSQHYHIPEKFFTTIYNGIDIEKWCLPPSDWKTPAIRRQYGIPDDAIVIIMTAAFRPEKNHIGALRSLHILHAKYNNKAYLLLVGDGVLFEQTKKQAKELGIEKFVKFAGHQKDVRPYYWACNLFTLCSTSVETFSIAALEAMACGLPAVLTNIGGANEMIVNKLNGFLCQPEETDIAQNWAKALKTNFSASIIHAYVHNNFNAAKMIDEYKKILYL